MTTSELQKIRTHVIRGRDEILAALKVVKAKPRMDRDLERLKLLETAVQALEVYHVLTPV